MLVFQAEFVPLIGGGEGAETGDDYEGRFITADGAFERQR